MTENKKNTKESIGIASVNVPVGASGDAPLRESVNAPTNSSKGKTLSSKTINDN